VNGKWKEDMDSSWFDYRAKRLRKINSRNLIKAFGDQAGFIPINNAICKLLQLVELVVMNDILMGRPWN
jgi:hypothetical protein